MILKSELGYHLRIDSTAILKNPIEPAEKFQKRFNRMKLRVIIVHLKEFFTYFNFKFI